ncbi:ParB/RepB/Spo0J family partition protein [Streptomyces sp. B-S-A8]|uniref:ParB/RepB/Spo0J family partition protein n=1 Tax=Streptomyces solicavernae TaxID=3043614 RepID=A0ABT6S3A1_9ACTN|nr:ParB/RepB/Spo0J family partition protein [Streptomyces sp. B-S-A8]MDI3390488.1 ParB/RepB/Spo0J family partition protein [Streptomyces sp. B-S-A8]
MSSSRDEYDDFFGDSEPEAGPSPDDTRAEGRLLRVPLKRLAPNTVNPRRNFGTQEALEDLGRSLKRRQQQPITVVSKGKYLKLWDHTDQISDVDYVIVSGERRYRGALAGSLSSLEAVVNDAIATSRKSFLDAVMTENVDRENFDPVEEAYAVQAMVNEFGTNRAVAEHFGRADGWVTQRVCLTYLSPELQQQVRARTLSLELARSLGQKAKKHGWDSDEQKLWLQQQRELLDEERKAKKEERRQQKAADRAKPDTKVSGDRPSLTAVKPPSESQAPVPGETNPSGEGAQHATTDAPADHEQLPDLVVPQAVRWGDVELVHRTLRQWMTDENYQSLRKRMLAEGS